MLHACCSFFYPLLSISSPCIPPTSHTLTFSKRLRHHYCVAKPGRSMERAREPAQKTETTPPRVDLPRIYATKSRCKSRPNTHTHTPSCRSASRCDPSRPSPNFNHPSVSCSPRAIFRQPCVFPRSVLAPFVRSPVRRRGSARRDPPCLSRPNPTTTPREAARAEGGGGRFLKGDERAKWVRDCVELELATQRG